MSGIRVVTNEQDRLMIEAYLAGASAPKAARLVGLSPSSCVRALHRHNILIRTTRIQADELADLVERFRGGSSVLQLSAETGRKPDTLRRVLRQAGERTPKIGEASRRWHFNERYFQSVTTEEQAYWLGFITADGCVSKRDTDGRGEYGLSIGLQQADADHLRKLAVALGSVQPVREYEVLGDDGMFRQVASIAFSSKLLFYDLAALDIHPRKSLTVRPWDGPEELLPAYWRGVIDGDGGIYKHQRQRRLNGQMMTEWAIGCCGSLAQMIALADYLARKAGTTGRPITSPSQRKLWLFKCSGSALPQSVARLLYANSQVHLDRKKTIAEELLAQDFPNQSWEHLTKQELLSLHETMRNWNAVGRHYGMKGGTIYKVRDRLGILAARRV